MQTVKQALIADDHSLYRHGLALLLKDQLGFQEVLEAATFETAVDSIDASPDIELALFDLAMPGMQGANSLSPLQTRHPNIKIAIVAASEAKSDVLAAIAAGLSGFIPKSLPVREFVAALEFVRAGGIYVPGLMKVPEPQRLETSNISAAEQAPETDGANRPAPSLTPRQKEVLDCIRAGMSNRAIAEKLGISIGTVKVHVAALLTALNVRNRVQLSSLTP